jgi:hypothetical protein
MTLITFKIAKWTVKHPFYVNAYAIFSKEIGIRNLKVVGNEKVGGSRRWHMIDIGLGPW